MKYRIIFLLSMLNIALYALAEELNTTITSGEYKLKTGGAIQSQTYDNQTKAKAAATKISQACGCRVDILQPTLTVTTVKASSSKSSVSSASSSVSVSSSSISVISSSAQSSSVGPINTVPVAGLQKLNVCMPLQRTDNETLPKEEMIAYKFRVFSTTGYVETEQSFKGVECDVYVVSIPEGALRLDVAAVAKAGSDSAYVPVEF